MVEFAKSDKWGDSFYRSKAHHACNKTHSGSLNKLQEIGFLLPSFLDNPTLVADSSGSAISVRRVGLLDYELTKGGSNSRSNSCETSAFLFQVVCMFCEGFLENLVKPMVVCERVM